MPSKEPALHPSNCYAIVRSHAFFGALAFAESAESITDPIAYADSIRNRIPDCDCFAERGTEPVDVRGVSGT